MWPPPALRKYLVVILFIGPLTLRSGRAGRGAGRESGCREEGRGYSSVNSMKCQLLRVTHGNILQSFQSNAIALRSNVHLQIV